MLGNEALTRQIAEQANAGSLSHACLITGERGMGKKELAGILCLEVFCRKKIRGRACRCCPDCKKVLSGNHPDLIRVQHEKPGVISVEDIRTQISDTADIRPYEGGKKVYIIDDAQKMTVQAQNALLKKLEEPPEYVLLLLLCDDERVLLDTIRSRCTKMKPERIEKSLIRNFLEENGADPDTAETAAAFAGGNPGRAKELAFSEEFKKAYRAAVGLCRNLKTMDAAQIAQTAKELASGEEDIGVILELLETWYRDLLCFRATGSMDGVIFRGEQSAIRAQANALKPETAARILSACEETAAGLKVNVNKELSLTMLFLKMREL